jgi:uncharacterized protein (TIGR03437 family)
MVVASRNIGIFTLNQAGSGPAVAQNFNSAGDQPLNTLVTPARPGQTVTLWATGLGAVSGDEAASPQIGDLGPISLYVGDKPATVRYAAAPAVVSASTRSSSKCLPPSRAAMSR